MIERTTLQALRVTALVAGISLLPACGAPPVRKGDSLQATARASSRDVETSAAATDPDAVHAERLPVRFHDLKQLAGTLRDVFQPDARGHGPVRAILVDDATRELVVIGTPSGVQAVRRMLGPGCSAPAESADRVEVVHLVHADARGVLHLLSPVVEGSTRITADSAMNAIVIRGSELGVQRVKRTLAALDVERKR